MKDETRRAVYRDYRKQHHIVGIYSNEAQANIRALSLEGKVSEVKVKKGKKGAAWGRERDVWRVIVKG